MILLHSMKKFAIVHHLFPYNLRNASKSLYRVLTLTAQTYTEPLLNDGSVPDGRSYSLYRVLILTSSVLKIGFIIRAVQH